MGIKFGEIDATQIIENEYRIGVLEGILNLFLQRTSIVQQSELAAIQKQVLTQLQRKYPNSGIGVKSPDLANDRAVK